MKNMKSILLRSYLFLPRAFSIVITFSQLFEKNFLTENNNTTYLIDENQNIAHTWNLSTECNYTVQLKDNGNIVRGGKYAQNALNGAAIGGMVQEIDPSGNVVWEYIYSNANHVTTI